VQPELCPSPSRCPPYFLASYLQAVIHHLGLVSYSPVPDGQQAELNYDAGFLGRGYTKVTLKRSGCCRHIVVFWHGGPSWFDDPKIEWLDNRHLRITYHTRRDDPQHCEQKMGDIAVACISSPWPDSPTLDQPQTGVSAKP
jgi:hypothetical protein